MSSLFLVLHGSTLTIRGSNGFKEEIQYTKSLVQWSICMDMFDHDIQNVLNLTVSVMLAVTADC